MSRKIFNWRTRRSFLNTANFVSFPDFRKQSWCKGFTKYINQRDGKVFVVSYLSHSMPIHPEVPCWLSPIIFIFYQCATMSEIQRHAKFWVKSPITLEVTAVWIYGRGRFSASALRIVVFQAFLSTYNFVDFGGQFFYLCFNHICYGSQM